MKLSEAKQPIMAFVAETPQPENPALQAAWLAEYTKLWNRLPWYYVLQAMVAIRQ
jgi:hypothetical protein